MPFAFHAYNLSTIHTMTQIFFLTHRFIVNRCTKTGPSCPRIKFRLGRKQRRTTVRANIHSRFVMIPVFPTKCLLCSFLFENVVLFWCQVMPSFCHASILWITAKSFHLSNAVTYILILIKLFSVCCLKNDTTILK